MDWGNFSLKQTEPLKKTMVNKMDNPINTSKKALLHGKLLKSG